MKIKELNNELNKRTISFTKYTGETKRSCVLETSKCLDLGQSQEETLVGIT